MALTSPEFVGHEPPAKTLVLHCRLPGRRRWRLPAPHSLPMSASPSPASCRSDSCRPDSRRLLHRRAIAIEVFARDDGSFDVEACLTDVKTDDMRLGDDIRPAGEPVHDMRLQVTIDPRLTVMAAGSATLAMPYPGACDQHGQAYQQLVGLNLMQGFRRAVHERLGGVRGCSHLTELADLLPTAVLQAMAGSVVDPTHARADGSAPFQLDRCHALRSSGPTVALHYPRWHRADASPAEAAPSS